MTSLISSSPLAVSVPAMRSQPQKIQAMGVSVVGGLRIPKIQHKVTTRRSSRISCSIVAQPETLEIVTSTIAKQLSIEESSVNPQTKFADLGADSLDTVEIMMALEERFEVSVGESGAENIATVQDAADLIEKVKTEAARS